MDRAPHRLAPPVPGIPAAFRCAAVAAAKSLFADSSNVVIDSVCAAAPSGVRIDLAGASHRRHRLCVAGQTPLAQHHRPDGGPFRNAVDYFRIKDSRSRALLYKLVALSFGVGGFAQAAQADPTVYQTLDFGTYDTFLTGIRGNNIVGNYIIPGTTDTGGIYYNMTTQTWAPMPEATPNGANYPGAIGSSPYGPNFGNPDGILRVVGSYQTLNSSPYDYSYLYDAAAAPGQTLTNLIYPSSGGAQTLFTIAHSTFGDQVVGDYDTALATGNAFIYNISTGTYTTNNIPGAVSTTAYGIYGNKIAGGYAMPLVGGGLGPEHGYIYDQTTDAYETFDHPGAIATHFEGITGGGRTDTYNLVANWISANGDVHPAVMHIDALGHVTWYEIDIPGTVVSSNSAYGDNVIGIYIDGGGIHGYLATIPGIYNPIENTGAVTFGGVNAAAFSGGVGDDIVNSGSIQVSGNGGLGIRGETYGVLTNTGTIVATGIAGAAVEMHGLYGTLLNSGTLQTTAVADALRTGADAEGSVIVNTGVIDGRIAANLGPDKRMENSGWIGYTGTEVVPIVSYFRGTFVQTAAGTFAPRVTDAGNDVLRVDGTVRVAGALEANFQTTTTNLPTTATLLGATEGITGAFDRFTTTGLPALFGATLDYTPNTLTMNIAADLAGLPGNTPNQRAVGAAIDGIINGTASSGTLANLPDALSPLYGLTSTQLPGALSALSGEAYASEQSVLIGDSFYTRQALLGRLRQSSYSGEVGPTAALSFGGPAIAYAAPAGLGAHFSTDAQGVPRAAFNGTIWSQAFGGWSDYDGAGTASVDASLGGFVSGADAKVEGWRVGAALGYSHSSANVDALASSSDVESLLLALYAGKSFGPWRVRLGASYAFNQIDAERTIAYPGYAEQAKADYDGGTAQGFAEVSYGFAVQKVAIEPFAGVAFVNLDTDGFTETGASAGLKGSSTSTGVGYSSLGLRVASTTKVSGGLELEPHASIAWQYAFGDIVPETQMSFLSAPVANFIVAGVPLAENTAEIEIGSDLHISEQTQIGLSYVGQFAGDVTTNAVQGNLTWRYK